MAAAKKQKRRKVGRVMREYKRGQLKSGGRRKVKNRKQAIAIAMSESGQSRNRKKKGAAKRKKAGAKRKKAR